MLNLKREINQFIIRNSDNVSVDISFLSIRLNEIDIVIQRECGIIWNET